MEQRERLSSGLGRAKLSRKWMEINFFTHFLGNWWIITTTTAAAIHKNNILVSLSHMQQKTPSRVINFLVRLTLTKKKSKKGLRTLPSLHGFAFYYFDQWIFMGKGSHRSGKEKKYNRQSLSFVAKGETIKNLWKKSFGFFFPFSPFRNVWLERCVTPQQKRKVLSSLAYDKINHHKPKREYFAS